jgi:hypothetical protein
MKAIIIIVGAVAVTFAMRMVVAFPVALVFMWCWDGFAPALFKLPTIRYWQAYALCLLLGMVASMFSTNVNVKK